MRKSGYYWVRKGEDKPRNWHPLSYDSELRCWWYKGATLLNSFWDEIDETPIERNDKLWGFFYCCDTYESAYALMSLHRTQKGAEIAMEFHRHEEKIKWDKVWGDHLAPVEFGKSEEWKVEQIKIQE